MHTLLAVYLSITYNGILQQQAAVETLTVKVNYSGGLYIYANLYRAFWSDKNMSFRLWCLAVMWRMMRDGQYPGFVSA